MGQIPKVLGTFAYSPGQRTLYLNNQSILILQVLVSRTIYIRDNETHISVLTLISIDSRITAYVETDTNKENKDRHRTHVQYEPRNPNKHGSAYPPPARRNHPTDRRQHRRRPGPLRLRKQLPPDLPLHRRRLRAHPVRQVLGPTTAHGHGPGLDQPAERGARHVVVDARGRGEAVPRHARVRADPGPVRGALPALPRDRCL
ncbi:hypothetical protein BJ166DRAFT_537022 [Pestalotiopsis sp. NC0098]|nr:hypothetical protein BJ166DRAFT_537022 [Pestalotiopsis sp. NC0098]